MESAHPNSLTTIPVNEENEREVALNKLKECCRLCMCPYQDISLFSDYQNSVKYIEVASSFFNIKITSDCSSYPDKVCIECASKLILFHKFRLKCESVNAEMSGIIERSHAVQKPFFVDVLHEPIETTTTTSSSRSVEDQSNTFGMKCEHIKGEHNDEEEYIKLNETIAMGSPDAIIEEDHLDDDEQEELFYDHQQHQSNDEDEVYESVIEESSVPLTDGDQFRVVAQFISAENESEPVPVVRVSRKLLDRECEQCGRLFTRKSTLDQHRVTHTGEKNYVCLQCGKHFSRHSHLLIHMRIHNNEKPFVCEVCSRAFVKSSDLIRHRRIHSDDRNYLCTICPKRFKRSTDVVTHMRSHTGVKPYSCNTCNKSYTSHSSLKKHTLLHEATK